MNAQLFLKQMLVLSYLEINTCIHTYVPILGLINAQRKLDLFIKSEVFEKVIEYIGKEIAIFLQLIFSFECLLPTHM